MMDKSGLFGDPTGLVQRAMESPAIVAIYESRFWRRSLLARALMGITFEQELDCIARAARLNENSRVLDLACGSGIYTRPFARHLAGGSVIGLDISRPMLAFARTQSRAEGLSNLDLVRGTALALPFQSATFDVVNCCGALHLFPDVPRALAEASRVLVPGGRFTAAVVRQGNGSIDSYSAWVRRCVLGVHSFTRTELGEMLTSAGFSQFDTLHEQRLWMISTAIKENPPGKGSSDLVI